MYVYMCVRMYIYIYICTMVWSGRVGGGWRVRIGIGAVAGRWWGWCWGGQGSHASHKPHKIAHAPVFINLNLYFKPYTQPQTPPKSKL